MNSPVLTLSVASSFFSSSSSSPLAQLLFSLPLRSCSVLSLFLFTLPTLLSTSFLDLLVQSAVSAAAAISLSDKSQVLRSQKELKALLFHGARTEEARSCIADVTMPVNCYARRTLKLRYLRELYYQLSRPWMVASLTRRTERFLLSHWFVSLSETIKHLWMRFVESEQSLSTLPPKITMFTSQPHEKIKKNVKEQ